MSDDQEHQIYDADEIPVKRSEKNVEQVPSWEELRHEARFVLRHVELSYNSRETENRQPFPYITALLGGVAAALAVFAFGGEFLPAKEQMVILFLGILGGWIGVTGFLAVAFRSKRREDKVAEMAMRLKAILADSPHEETSSQKGGEDHGSR